MSNRGITEEDLRARESWERCAANAYELPDEQVLDMIAEIRRLRAVVEESVQRCTNCGRFHPNYKGEYCPSRDDGGY